MPIAFERMRMARTEKKDRYISGHTAADQVRGRAARCVAACFKTFLAGLVVFAERLNPIPSRTRPLNFPAPMVLSLKAWKSRSLPGLPRTLLLLNTMIDFKRPPAMAAVFHCKNSEPALSSFQSVLELRADHSAA